MNAHSAVPKAHIPIDGCFPKRITWAVAKVGDLLLVKLPQANDDPNEPVVHNLYTALLEQKSSQADGPNWFRYFSVLSSTGNLLDGSAGMALPITSDTEIYLLGELHG